MVEDKIGNTNAPWYIVHATFMLTGWGLLLPSGVILVQGPQDNSAFGIVFHPDWFHRCFV
jgi:hypothetical protein